jgi:hypothetical protein
MPRDCPACRQLVDEWVAVRRGEIAILAQNLSFTRWLSSTLADSSSRQGLS